MTQFFKQTFASLVGTLAAIALLGTLGVSGLLFLLLSLALNNSSPKVEDKSFLVFDLSTVIRDHQPNLTLGQILSGEEVNTLPLRHVLTAIDKATQDERIIGIFLDGRNDSSENGYGTLEEVHQALERFKATGKKIIAYDLDSTEKDYFLTSLADKLVLNPMGGMELNGIGSEQMFLTGALEKYGIGVQVIRVGQFKAAVEPYTRQNLSPENREQLEDFIGDIWASFLSKVSKNRKIPPNNIQRIANTQGILTPEQAKTAGLVDHVAYFDEVITELQSLTGKPQKEDKLKNTFRQISLTNYVDVPVKGVSEKTSNNKIALVYAEGTIVNGQGSLDTVGGERFAQILRKIRQDDQVKGVILRINSPGGSATASDIILREVQLISKEKPVVVSMGNVAASGGYWIATGAKRIFAQTDTVTGSIGVFGLLLNFQEIGNNNGITWDRVQTSPLATLSSSSRPKTPQELALFQKSVNRVYDLFLDRVSQSRNLPKAKVHEIAQGRVWSGLDAQKLGLIDEIGGIEAAIAYTVNVAKLGEDWEIEEYPESKGLESLIVQKLDGTDLQNSLDPLTREWLKLKGELKVLSSLDDPKGVYTRLPFSWQFD